MVVSPRGSAAAAVTRPAVASPDTPKTAKEATMYEPSRHVTSFNIAGFQHWDGATVLSELAPGMVLALDPEPDNPFDPEAVAIRYKGVKLGFVPAAENGLLSVLLHFGHAGVIECRVQQVNPEVKPWEQVLVGLFVTDARE